MPSNPSASACPERACAAGFRRIGVGALFGLADWREEALRLGAHLDFLQRHCWRAHYTVAFPRMRPHAGGYQPTHPLGDSALVQLVCAMRLVFPEVGIVLSTREPAFLRDVLAPVGITLMSAGSHTEPGGYTGEGGDDLHRTVRGRRVELETGESGEDEGCRATGQFEIADHRSAAELAAVLRDRGLEPVWKDWDPGILSRKGSPEAAGAALP